MAELLMHTAIPTITTHQQYIPGSYPTASPNSVFPITDEVQRFNETTNFSVDQDDFNVFFTTLSSSTSTQPPAPLPLILQHQHIIYTAGLDDLGKAQEIVKERVLIEIAALRAQLERLEWTKQDYYDNQDRRLNSDDNNNLHSNNNINQQDHDNNNHHNNNALSDLSMSHPSHYYSSNSNPAPDHTIPNSPHHHFGADHDDLNLDNDPNRSYPNSTAYRIEFAKRRTNNTSRNAPNTNHPPHPRDIINLEEEDLIRKIQILDHYYRVLVFESTARNKKLIAQAPNQLADDTSNKSSQFRALLPTIPSLSDFEQETQRYILSIMTLAAYIGIALLYRNGFNWGSRQDDDNFDPNPRVDSTSDSSQAPSLSSSVSNLFSMMGNASAAAFNYTASHLPTASSDLDSTQSSASTWSSWFALPWYSSAAETQELDFDTSDGTRRLDLTGQTLLGTEEVLDNVAGESYDQVYDDRTS